MRIVVNAVTKKCSGQGPVVWSRQYDKVYFT